MRNNILSCETNNQVSVTRAGLDDDFPERVRQAMLSMQDLGSYQAMTLDFLDRYVLLLVGLCNLQDYDELATNHLSFEPSFSGIRPASIKHITSIAVIARETARRRLCSLEKRGYVEKFDGGYVVSDWQTWSTMIGLFSPIET